MRSFPGGKVFLAGALFLATLASFSACRATAPGPTAAPKPSAQELLQATIRNYHLPSAEASGQEREKLLNKAAARYQRIVREYPGDAQPAAIALRSLGNIRSEQKNPAAALALYDEVARRYPREEWEVLQAWKAAGDLLWEKAEKNRARLYYRKIVQRFGSSESPAIIRAVVDAASKRLADPSS